MPEAWGWCVCVCARVCVRARVLMPVCVCLRVCKRTERCPSSLCQPSHTLPDIAAFETSSISHPYQLLMTHTGHKGGKWVKRTWAHFLYLLSFNYCWREGTRDLRTDGTSTILCLSLCYSCSPPLSQPFTHRFSFVQFFPFYLYLTSCHYHAPSVFVWLVFVSLSSPLSVHLYYVPVTPPPLLSCFSHSLLYLAELN